MKKYLFSTIIILLFIPISAFGDGCYFPQQAVKKLPEITMQRVLIVWKDGIETLLISSTLSSESQKLGWIIPLPVLPDNIEKISPGTLKTLSFCIQPKITHDLYPKITTAIFVVGIAILLCATFLYKRERFTDLIILIFIGILFFGLFAPTVFMANNATISNVNIEKTVRVGSYEINFVKANSTNDLNIWLKKNGYSSLPEKASNIIDYYINEKWIFAAIKLIRDEKGNNTPHPIKVSFKYHRPIYPFKLTDIALNNTLIEIFVIAEHKFSSKEFKTEYCDTFVLNEDYDSQIINEDYDKLETYQYYKGINNKIIIAHPSITNLMWNKCILTKLSGLVSPKTITNDILFEDKKFIPYQEHYFTQTGAISKTFISFVYLFGIFFIPSLIISKKKNILPDNKYEYFKTHFFPALTFIILISCTYYFLLPKLSYKEYHSYHPAIKFIYHRNLSKEIEKIIKSNENIYLMKESKIQSYITKMLDVKNFKNKIQGGKVIHEDSLGNFIVRRKNHQIEIKILDSIGKAVIYNYPEIKK